MRCCLACGIYHFIDPSIANSTATHRTWLKGYIKITTIQSPRFKFFASLIDGYYFCMKQSILSFFSFIKASCDNPAIFHDNSANWHLIFSKCLFSLSKRFQHKIFHFLSLHKIILKVKRFCCNL